MIDDVADSIVRRLKALFPDFDVDHFPDKPDDAELTKKRQALLVNFDGSTFGDQQTMAPMSCDEEVKFVVTLRVLGLRGVNGANNMLTEVRKKLYGWAPTKLQGNVEVTSGAGRMIPVDSGFVAVNSGVWRFAITFKTTIPAVEDLAAETGPNLTQVTFTPAAA